MKVGRDKSDKQEPRNLQLTQHTNKELSMYNSILTSLKKILCPTQPYHFAAYGNPYACQGWVTNQQTKVDRPKDDEFYIYKDNGSDILAVAHLDYVVHQQPTFKDGVVRCGQLDDRLGAWVILELLPTLGITTDILLTTNEEVGASTAHDFAYDWEHTEDMEFHKKQYNWLFEFDRRGTDIVMYDYETPELKTTMGNAGFKVGKGSFSDVCALEVLGCKAFNIGVGYHQEHTQNCYANLEDTFNQVAKFMGFYKEYKDTHLPHDPADNVWNRASSYNQWHNSHTSLNQEDKPYSNLGKTSHNNYNYDDWDGSYDPMHVPFTADDDVIDDETIIVDGEEISIADLDMEATDSNASARDKMIIELRAQNYKDLPEDLRPHKLEKNYPTKQREEYREAYEDYFYVTDEAWCRLSITEREACQSDYEAVQDEYFEWLKDNSDAELEQKTKATNKPDLKVPPVHV